MRIRLALAVMLAIVGAAALAFVIWNRPKPVRSDPAPNVDTALSVQLPVTADAARLNPAVIESACIDALASAGASDTNVRGVAESLVFYVSGVANDDFRSFQTLANAHGASPDPVLVKQTEQMILATTRHSRPAGFEDWSDEELLRQTLYKSPFDRWKSIDPGSFSAQTFRGAEALVRDLRFYRVDPNNRSASEEVNLAPFTIPGLERRLQSGDASGVVVSFSAIDFNNKHVDVSVLLGEYEPGKWFPVRHRTVTAR